MRQSQQNNAANSRSRSRSTYLPEIRCGRVAARRAEDNSGPMPLMEDVKIKPAKGIPFKFNVFPDTGCYQSLVASDLVKTYGMQVDRNCVKKIKAVDGGQMECSGSVAFQVTYESEKTDVLALVTPPIQDEVLLS